MRMGTILEGGKDMKKWVEYRIDIDKVVTCCDILKGN